MASLYLTEQGSVVRKRSDRLVVEKDRVVLLEVPCLKLDSVVIYGNVQVTTQALVELLDQGIELAILSRSGRLRGQLTPPKARNVPLRMKQYELAHQEAFCLQLARELVRGKIAGSVAVLRRFRANHPEAFPEAEVTALERSIEALDLVETIDALRGFEGAAAARYFGALRAMAPPELGFDGRNRRPPTDPVNALLSFGYVLVGNELQSLLDAIGFDPYVGSYHQLDYGRPSLALDLLEELRAPLVDRFSLGLLNRHVLGKNDFRKTADGLRGRAEPALPGRRAGALLPRSLPPPSRAPGPRPGWRRDLPEPPLSMLIVVSYDVPDDRRRAGLANDLKDFGSRVQYSVFECRLNREQLGRLRERLLRRLDLTEDRLRIYGLCQECLAKVEVLGRGTLTEDPDVYVL